MSSNRFTQSVCFTDGKILVNGKEVPPLPKEYNYSHITQCGGRVFFNGYELVDGTWKRTIRSLLHL